MLPDGKSKKTERHHVDQEPELPSQDANNIGTVGYISYKDKEGKGSFKNIGKERHKKPNVEGIGENEEDHSTKI